MAGLLPCSIVSAQYKYPPTREVPVTDHSFNIKVEDPYRWMEDMDHAGTQQWFKAQGLSLIHI